MTVEPADDLRSVDLAVPDLTAEPAPADGCSADVPADEGFFDALLSGDGDSDGADDGAYPALTLLRALLDDVQDRSASLLDLPTRVEMAPRSTVARPRVARRRALVAGVGLGVLAAGTVTLVTAGVDDGRIGVVHQAVAEAVGAVVDAMAPSRPTPTARSRSFIGPVPTAPSASRAAARFLRMRLGQARSALDGGRPERAVTVLVSAEPRLAEVLPQDGHDGLAESLRALRQRLGRAG